MRFLARLAARASGAAPAIQPRLPSRFESAAAPEGGTPPAAVDAAPAPAARPVEETTTRLLRVEEVLRRETHVAREERITLSPQVTARERVIERETAPPPPAAVPAAARLQPPVGETPRVEVPREPVETIRERVVVHERDAPLPPAAPARDVAPPREQQPPRILAAEVERVLETVRERTTHERVVERSRAAPPMVTPAIALPPPVLRREPAVPEAPTIHVTIGRVDVRAVTQPAPAARPAATAQPPALSLADYLAQRERGPR